MAKRKPPSPTMYAIVDCTKLLVPVEQLGIFESCMQVEERYEKGDDGEYRTNQWISEIPKLPKVQLISENEVIAWQVAGKMRTK